MYPFKLLKLLVACVLFAVGILLIVSEFGNALPVRGLAIVCWISGSVLGIGSVKRKTHQTDTSSYQGRDKSPTMKRGAAPTVNICNPMMLLGNEKEEGGSTTPCSISNTLTPTFPPSNFLGKAARQKRLPREKPLSSLATLEDGLYIQVKNKEIEAAEASLEKL